MCSSGNDAEVLVFRHGIGFPDKRITLGLAFHHVVIGRFSHIAGMGVFPVDDQDRRTDLVDIKEETGVVIGLDTDDPTAVVGIAAAGMVTARRLVIVVVILHELRGIVRERVHHTAGHRHRIGEAQAGKGLPHRVAGSFIVGRIEIAVAAVAGHVVHRNDGRGLDPGIGSRRIEADAAPAADSDDADALRIHVLLPGQEIDRRQEVLRIDVGRSGAAGFSAAFSGEGRVESKRDESALGHIHGVKAAGLLLAGTERAAHCDRGKFPVCGLGFIQVGRKGKAELVVKRHFPGLPKSMVNNVIKPIKIKVIDLYYDMTASCMTESDEIIDAGEKMLGVILAMEAAGYRFNLYTTQNYYDSGNGCDMVCVKVKSANQPFDLKRMSFPVAHTAFFRGIGFEWYSKFPIGRYRFGYGHSIFRDKEREEVQEEYRRLFGDNIFCFSATDIIKEGDEADEYIRRILRDEPQRKER